MGRFSSVQFRSGVSAIAAAHKVAAVRVQARFGPVSLATMGVLMLWHLSQRAQHKNA